MQLESSAEEEAAGLEPGRIGAGERDGVGLQDEGAGNVVVGRAGGEPGEEEEGEGAPPRRALAAAQAEGSSACRRSVASMYSCTMSSITRRVERISFMRPTIWPTGLKPTGWALAA